MDALATLVNSRLQNVPTQNAAPNTNQSAQTNRCHFCGKTGCRIASCPDVEAQIKAGNVSRSADGKVTLPSGNYLPRNVVGRTLAEKFAQYHIDNPGQRATPSATIQPVATLETVSTLIHAEVCDDDEDDDEEYIEEPDETLEDLARVFATEAARRMEKGKKRVTNTSNKAAEPVSKQHVPSPKTINPPSHHPVNASQNNTVAKPEPAFHFESPCESSALVTQVWNKTLDAAITITPRELLAVSTDMRKRFKEFTTTKRIPGPQRNIDTALFDMLYSQMTTDGDGKYVANDSAPLRTLRARLGNALEFDCVIDNGSSIIAISKDVWARLGAPVRSDLVMRMESSHGTVEKTIGVLKNFPVTIGGEVFPVQVQVSENLPCEVLLGRPFFMFTSATTTDHPDGTQEITLTNPNTGREITLPTQERSRKKQPKKQEDF